MIVFQTPSRLYKGLAIKCMDSSIYFCEEQESPGKTSENVEEIKEEAV